MDTEKYKDWLIKISNAKIQKPAQIAKIRALSSKIEQLSIQVNQLVKRSQKTISASQEYVNNKTSQLLTIQNKDKDNCYKILKQVQKQKENNHQKHILKIKKMQQFQSIIAKKSKSLQAQFNKKNKKYEQILFSQLESIRQLKIKVSQRKDIRKQQFNVWIKNSIKKADRILESQQKDLELIDQYQKELITRCDNVSDQYVARLKQMNEQSERKQKTLFRKLEILISDIDVA